MIGKRNMTMLILRIALIWVQLNLQISLEMNLKSCLLRSAPFKAQHLAFLLITMTWKNLIFMKEFQNTVVLTREILKLMCKFIQFSLLFYSYNNFDSRDNVNITISLNAYTGNPELFAKYCKQDKDNCTLT